MKQIIFAFILAFGFGLSVFAQNENSTCPKIEVSGGGVTDTVESMSFTVSLVDAAKNLNLEYLWTVSQGKIIEGQGTTTIKVDISNLKESENNVTATVVIKGLSENCKNTGSETGSLIIDYVYALLIDEFGKLRDGEVKERIKEMYLKLANEPGSQGYIIDYGTDKEISVRENQFRNAVASFRFDTSRVTFVRGGANPNGAGVWTRIWIVPPGAVPPTP